MLTTVKAFRDCSTFCNKFTFTCISFIVLFSRVLPDKPRDADREAHGFVRFSLRMDSELL